MNRKKSFKIRIVTFVFCFLLCALFAPKAKAYTTIDTEASTSLSLKYDFPGVTFKLYKVADVSSRVVYTPSIDFANYAVDFDAIKSSSVWMTVSETLAAYVDRDKLTPIVSGQTDKDGTLSLTGLKTGLYLVIGERHSVDTYDYTPTSFLISLPNLNTETDEWEYEVTSKVKYEKESNLEFISRTVVKLWDDHKNKSRPQEVVIQLLCDGEVYDEVTLNDKNSWKHTWKKLRSDCKWQVTEKSVPKDYKVQVKRNKSTFRVTNIYKGAVNPTVKPTPNPRLAQSGQLKWPIPLLAVAGIVMFTIGWFYNRKKEIIEE